MNGHFINLKDDKIAEPKSSYIFNKPKFLCLPILLLTNYFVNIQKKILLNFFYRMGTTLCIYVIV